uniref:Epidermal growth factor receptor substrate 15 n=1 Tax=Cacopsylla melanoneura TaxID=428564 RepID=A0A8D8RJV7_9HEMI
MPFKILWPLDFLVCSSPSYPRCRVSICFFFSVPSRLFFSIIFLVSSVLLLFFVFFIILCFYFHFIFHFISLSSVLFMIFNFVFPPSLFLFAPPTSRLCPSQVKSQQVSSPFSPSSAYGSSTSSLLSPPHSSLKSPPSPSSSSPAAASTTSVIGRPTSITSQFASPSIIGRPTPGGGAGQATPSWGTPGGASSSSGINNSFSSTTSTTSAAFPPLTDFTDDPFKDYRYEDPFNIVDPFSDDDLPLPARTNPDGGSSHFDPFVESGRSSAGIPATTLPSRGGGGGGGGMTQSLSHSSSFLTETDMFSNDPFFSSPAKSQPAAKSGRTSAPPLSTSKSLSSFTTDPFFSQTSTNGGGFQRSDDPFKSTTGAATTVNNGFAGDPFSFSTNNQSNNTSSNNSSTVNKFADSFSNSSASVSNKFADDNFSSSGNQFGDDNFTGFADSFSTSTVSNQFGDDNFSGTKKFTPSFNTPSLNTMFSGDQASETARFPTSLNTKFTVGNPQAASLFNSESARFPTSSSMSTKPSITSSSKLNGGGSGELPSEDEQMKWAALESLKLESEQKRKESQERADLELAMKLSQEQGADSFPVNW